MTDPPNRRARRSLPDLSGLYDSIETEKTPAPDLRPAPEPPLTPPAPAARTPGPAAALPEPPAAQQESPPLAGSADAKDNLALPPELAYYLPPDLWRKLNAGTLRSGVLINALDRLRSLQYTISTYLPGDLVQEKLNHPVPGLVGGKMLEGCLLFSDVSGFTALSERLAGLGLQGAEKLTQVINQYFASMIEILSQSGGTLLKFAGDATLVHFSEQPGGMHAHWAARTALRMLAAMTSFASLDTPLGPVALKMKIGIAGGPFLAASIGTPKRMEYALIGKAISDTMQAESLSSAGQIVINQTAASLLGEAYSFTPVKPGFALLAMNPGDELDSFEIRPEKRRARGVIPWSASSAEILAEIQGVLRQIQALTPYLASELVDRIVAHANQRQVQSEFRPTTAMFCNFTGPEKLLERWGSPGVTRVTGLLSAYFADMNEIITRFGGIVSRIDPYSQGTKLMALFGAPVAHEDDAQRAVSTALAMNHALEELNQRWAQKLARHLPAEARGELIQQRIGITMGSSFAGQAGASTRREYTVMGDPINLAARLMSTASPGQILVSDAVVEKTGAYYLTQALPPVRVKGKSKPIPIYQVDGVRDDMLLTRIRGRKPLIGRVHEQARWQEVLEQARQGHGGVFALTGPAGIGKSHLADILGQQAQAQGWQVSAYPCRSFQSGEAFASWAGWLRAQAGITSADHALIQKEKLDRLFAQYRLSAAHSATLMDLLGLREEAAAGKESAAESSDDLFSLVKARKASRRASQLDVLSQLKEDVPQETGGESHAPGREARQRQQALQAVLAAMAARGPAVIFFEDAHWMDDSSRAFLRALSQQPDRPLVFLLNARPLEDSWPDLGEVITLGPLDQHETFTLAASVLVGELAEIIHQQSGGSPLFVEEISHWIQQTRKIGAADLRGVLQSSDILQKLVLSSLENLPEAQRETARLASVVGMAFTRSELESLFSPPPDPVSLGAQLRGLARARMITLTESGVDQRYAFVQSIFRDILYNSLPFERRRELHARLAEHLSARPNRRRALHDKIAAFLDAGASATAIPALETLAYHYEMAEQWLPAARQLHQAALLLDPENDAARAEGFYTRALGLLEHIAPEASTADIIAEKARIHTRLGDAASRRGDLPAALAAYTSASGALASPLADISARTAVNLAARLVLLLPSGDRDVQRAEQLARSLAQLLPEAGWSQQALLAWLAWREGSDPREHIDCCQALLPADPPRDALRPSTRVRALLAELSGDFAQAVALYSALGEAQGVALARVRWGDHLLAQGEAQEAEEQYQQAADAWQQLRSASGLALVAYRRAEIAWQQGSQTSTLALLEEALNWIAKSPPALQPNPQESVQLALARVKRQHSDPWAPWDWQPFDDLFRIQLLLPLFQEPDTF